MRNFILFLSGYLLILITEVLKVYWIMPFPGSQQTSMVASAYFTHHNILYFRIIGIALMFYPVWVYLTTSKWIKKIAIIIALLFLGVVFYFSTYIAQADRMFLQPQEKIFATSAQNNIEKYHQVIVVSHNGESRAYPIELIGYHHQVQDTIQGKEVMITYCTVCRTGRVYEPLIDGKKEHFRLVGMDMYNAMFEDETTKSWWQQSTGECVAGKLKGNYLTEFPSEQMSIASFFKKYPDGKILQADPKYRKQYSFLEGYDEGIISEPLEQTNFNSWELKSWVVGVKINDGEKAYDWNDLKTEKIINDTIKNTPVVILFGEDATSFYTYSRKLDSLVLNFKFDLSGKNIIDTNTNSIWNYFGVCEEGILKDKKLLKLQSYQEFWHSWKEFHPNTTAYKKHN